MRCLLALLDPQESRQLFLPCFPVSDASVPTRVRAQLLTDWLAIRNVGVIPYGESKQVALPALAAAH